MENQSGRIELKRDLGTWPAMSIVVGTVIGSGIFLVPRTMIQRVGTVEAVFAVWIVGGLLSRLLLSVFLSPVLYAVVAREDDVLKV